MLHVAFRNAPWYTLEMPLTDPDIPTPPLPSEVEAVFAKPQAAWTVDDIAVLYRHLDHDPLCRAWPSAARMLIRRFIDAAGPGRPRNARTW